MGLRDLDYGQVPPPGSKGCADRYVGDECAPSNFSTCSVERPRGAVALARGTVNDQTEELQIVGRRLQSLRDRLFGDELVGDGAMPCSPPGEIGALCSDLERLEAVVLYIRRLTDWIEERL